MHVTRVLGRFNNFALTTGFYWSYMLLLKSLILMCYCDYTLAVITEEDWKWGLTAHTLRPSTWSCWKMSLVRRLSSFLNTVKVHVGLCKLHTSCVISRYCTNTWVTSTTSVWPRDATKQVFHWGASCWVPFSENLFGYIPGISTTTMHATKELLQGQMSKIKETELKLIYPWSQEASLRMIKKNKLWSQASSWHATPSCIWSGYTSNLDLASLSNHFIIRLVI